VPPDEPDYRALFEAAPGLFLVLRPDLMIAAVSDAYLDATMTRRHEILGRGIFEVFPDNPDDLAATGVSNLRASLDQVRASLVPDTMAVQKYDIRRPDADGGGYQVRYWSPVNSPVLDSAGRLAYIIHRVEDVTEFVGLKHLETERDRISDEMRTAGADIEAEIYRRAHEIADTNRRLTEANKELRRSELFLDSVVENIPDVVFVKDARDLRFVRFNRAGEELHGRSRSELIGRNDQDFFPPDQAAFFTAKDREALEGRHVVDIEEEPIDTPNHGRRILHTKKIPILDDAGQPAYLLGISEDITERKAAEHEIRAAREEAERANRAKTEFLSRMSHELRTPLNAILGFSQLLEMDPLSDDQQESVAYIARAGRHLLELINEVLDISRVESGQMTISLEPVAVDDLLYELAALVGPLAAGRKVTLDTSKVTLDTNEAAVAGYVVADRQRLKQVLLNLLSNAVKYNREGGRITVRYERVSDDRLRIAIVDTGYGIAPEYLDRLFHPFDRLGAEQGSVEGTGMGLALSKGLVEAMGGSLGVDSTLDVGSTFWVELALAEGPIERYERTQPLVTDEAAPGRPRRVILQIEDNLANVKLVERIVERRPGIELLAAMQGGLGIDLAREHRPDLILLDLHLPDIPGHEVLRLLQSYPETRNLPVVVLTADATTTQVARFIDAGAFGYLTKPLDVAEFLGMVDRAIHDDARTAS
jgi:PAS domain S-box-containing protein